MTRAMVWLTGFIQGLLSALLLMLLAVQCVGCVIHGGDTERSPGFAAFVHMCSNGADRAELCWDGNAETLAAVLGAGWACMPTLRHAGACLYQCPSQRGCNALHGCYCPEGS